MSLFKVKKQSMPKALHEKYVVPPFSVFNTHQPYYRERMRMWRDLGMCGTNGRITDVNGLSYDNRRMDKQKTHQHNGTSTFSPVVCEVVYKWFTPHEHSKIFDPFAGGITRGAIASVLGHDYIGYDINPNQIESNIEEFAKISERYDIKGSCRWECHNSADSYVDYGQNKWIKYDLIFTCPPYFNLEKYSDIMGDLSLHTEYERFMFDYVYIIDKCYHYLADNSFMVWVVSDVRRKDTGAYYGLVADTIKQAQSVGFQLYNEIILYNETGNLAITSGDYLKKARKVGRQHQNILVFYKGDTKAIRYKFKEL